MDENSNTPSASGAPEPQQPAPQPEAAPAQPMQPTAAAPENPFAAFGASASQPVSAPEAAPAAVPPEVARPASAATAPTQPYYDAAAAQAAQQPYAPYGQAADAGQPCAPYAQAAAQQPTYAPYDAAGYGTYGAGNQPPVPPAPAQNIYPGYEPPNPNQKRRWPWFLLGLAVGLVIGMGGCASCVGIMALADYDSSYDSYNSYDDGYDYNYDYDFGDTDMWAPEDSYGTDEDASPYGGFTLDEIASVFEADGVAAGEPGEGDVCAKGFYTVGPQGQIPAGLYYLEGSNEKLSHYYVFDLSLIHI